MPDSASSARTRPIGPASFRPATFAAALGASTLFILWAPFVGQLRTALRTAFPDAFVFIIGTVVLAAVLAAVIVAVSGIRSRRPLRYALIVSALVIAAGYAYASRTGRPDVDAVELFHFVEFGLVTYLFYRAWRPMDDVSVLVAPVLAAMLVGTLDEWFQWFIPARIGEVRDVFLNLVAIGCGLLFSLGVEPPGRFHATWRRGSAARTGAVAVVLITVLALFFEGVHLGHEIEDPEIGRFRSRYPIGRLLQTGAERADRWRQHPPLTWRRLSVEDQYMSEGLWHVQHRNAMWAAEDRSAAWRENRILEKYYRPVLDTPSYVSPTGHRWGEVQRAQADRVAIQDLRPYVSRAQPYPIFTWSRTWFWGSVMVLLGLVCAGAIRVERQASRSASPVSA